MAELITLSTTYALTTYINDRTAANTPTQCAVLRRYWRCTAVAGASTKTTQDVADSYANQTSPLYKALINNLAEYRGCACGRVTGAAPFGMDATNIAFAGVGTAGAIAMAKQTSGLVHLYSAFRGKQNRGRQYVPFPSTTSDQGNGIPTNAYFVLLANLVAFLDASFSVMSAGVGVTMSPVIWSPRTPASFIPVLTGAFGTLWATQKRRGDYGRTNISPI